MAVQPLTIKNAQIWTGNGAEQRDLYTADHVLNAPALGALEVDLSGYVIFPGLVNAHDHLELNHYPRTKFREVYNNAHEWGEDVNARLNESPFKELRAYPLKDRLFIGGLKNLLCGATTVAHHGPPHKAMFRPDFPVRVLRKYGWAHSLHFNTDEEVVRSYRSTPKGWPWFIHLAEGSDEVAAGEYQRLKALDCVGENTVIVHGIGVNWQDLTEYAKPIKTPLIWCPSTNKYLLGTVKDTHYWFGAAIPVGKGHDVAIGSDSRLTANGDLLDELKIVIQYYGYRDLSNQSILSRVTEIAAKILQLPNSGHLGLDAYADLAILKSKENAEIAVCDSLRTDLTLVVRGGTPQIGDPEMMAKFPHIQTVEATLDGIPKAINIHLARQIARCSLKEPGLELGVIPKRRFFVL